MTRSAPAGVSLPPCCWLCQAQRRPEHKLCGGEPGLLNWFAPGVYGGAPVTLQPKAPAADDDEVGAYAGRAARLTLSGVRTGCSLVLAESVWSGPGNGSQTTGCLTLSLSGTALSGTWRSPQGRALPIRLRLLDTPGVRTWRAEEPLAFLKLNSAWARTASSVTEPLSEVRYSRHLSRRL